MRTLKDLFLNSLAEVYYAENQLLRTLSKLAKADRNAEPREELESLLRETDLYVREVERVFAEFSQKARAENHPAIANNLEQSNKMVSESTGIRTTDTLIVNLEQKVERHGVATCGSLQNWAFHFSQNPAADEHRDDRQSFSQTPTCYHWRIRYPTWRQGGKPINRRFSSMHSIATSS